MDAIVKRLMENHRVNESLEDKSDIKILTAKEFADLCDVSELTYMTEVGDKINAAWKIMYEYGLSRDDVWRKAKLRSCYGKLPKEVKIQISEIMKDVQPNEAWLNRRKRGN